MVWVAVALWLLGWRACYEFLFATSKLMKQTGRGSLVPKDAKPYHFVLATAFWPLFIVTTEVSFRAKKIAKKIAKERKA